ncbi:phosphopyruvate hydratase [Tritrichomonas musculus]|uniref:phosphopyruvate hydratase n=1 Tax=Tritrichomonas musculus TaxID=1915356 RepID=A0ABR2HE62_9EUKA
MRYLHENGIAHRDLKPENILIDSYLYPHVSDFGLSKCFPDSLTKSYKLTISGQIGTPLYMAPELLTDDSDHHGPGIDVYAFSLIAYEILTGKRPYYELGQVSIYPFIQKVVRGYRPKFEKCINEKMRDLISKCWSQKVEERPSFEEIYEKLTTDFSYFEDSFDREEVQHYVNKLNKEREELSKKSVKEYAPILRAKLRKVEKEKEELERELIEMKKKNKLLEQKIASYDERSSKYNTQSNQAYEAILDKCKAEVKAHPTDDKIGQLFRLLRDHAAAPTISRLVGREVLNSQGIPTVETDVYVIYLGKEELAGRSAAPGSAICNGARDVLDVTSNRYAGRGTLTAASNVTNILGPALKGIKLNNLCDLDKKLVNVDGTELKEKIGGNAITATSFALAEAAAHLQRVEVFQFLARQFWGDKVPKKFHIPSPCFCMIESARHAGGYLKLQDFMIVISKKYEFPDQLRIAAEVYHKLSNILIKKFGFPAKNIGKEGGFGPCLNTPDETLDNIEQAISEAGFEPGEDIRICIDAAASNFYDSTKKLYEVEVGVVKTGDEMIKYWKKLISLHPSICSIEDGLDKDDHKHWQKLNAEIGSKCQLVGDYLFKINAISKGLKSKLCNALLLKVNNFGTISEAMNASRIAFDAQQRVVVSSRAYDTCDSLIADLSVAIGAQQIKAGAPARGECVQKYTRLLQIYEYLKANNLYESCPNSW